MKGLCRSVAKFFFFSLLLNLSHEVGESGGGIVKLKLDKRGVKIL